MELENSLVELLNIKVTATNLAIQLKLWQEKLSKMLQTLLILFNAKDVLENAIPLLRSCVRAQKQRKFNKLSGGKEYTLVCTNPLGLS